jgi:hypothetical protein
MTTDAPTTPRPAEATWGHSNEITESASDLVKLLGAVANPPNTRTGTIPGKEGKSGYQYRYAPLDELLDQLRPVLLAHNFGLMQFPATKGDRAYVTTTLLHATGEYWWCTLSLDAGRGAQSQGAAITYARRYSLLGVLGLFNDEDGDDGGARAQKAVDGRDRSERVSAQRSASRPASGRTADPAAASAAPKADTGPHKGKLTDEGRAFVEALTEAGNDAGVNENGLRLLARKVQQDAGLSPTVTTLADIGRPDVFSPDQHDALIAAIEVKAAQRAAR